MIAFFLCSEISMLVTKKKQIQANSSSYNVKPGSTQVDFLQLSPNLMSLAPETVPTINPGLT